MDQKARKVNDNVVIAEYLTRFNDMQEHEISKTQENLDKNVKRLRDSLRMFRMPLELLTDFKYTGELDDVCITRMPLFKNYTNVGLYFYRWEMCYDFLLKHSEIKFAALVDVSDVEMLNFPFGGIKPNTLYFGDELNDLSASIVSADSVPKNVKNFLVENSQLQLLNPGIIVGSRDILLEFLGVFVKILTDGQVKIMMGQPNKGFGNFEMALMNFVAYRYFSGRLLHGRQVSTRFRMWDQQSHAWFKHK